MSNDNMWGEDEAFSDMPEEAQTGKDGKPVPVQHEYSPPTLPKPSPRPQARPSAPPVEAIEKAEEVEVEEEPEEDFSDVLTDASLRLEQGSLWKMIMNHNLFEGVDADPRAIQNVQKKIREFAKECMEVMLGMRKETSIVEHLEIDFPFNQKEVEVLKALAYKASLGETQNSDNYVPEVKRTTEEVLNVPRKKTLNPIGGTTAPKKQNKALQNKPLQSKPSAPVKRTKMDAIVEQIAREEGIPRELLEENLKGVGGKPLHELTVDEVIERNKLVKQRRGTQVKSSSSIPMASPEQQEMLVVERVNQLTQSSSPLMSRLLETVKKMPPSIKNT